MSACLTEITAVISQTTSDPWAQQFTKLICKKASRSDWRPSQKQRAMMTRLIHEWEAGDSEVIEPDTGASE